MKRLHLGVIDLPYVNYNAPQPIVLTKRGKPKKKQPAPVYNKTGMTTGRLARILEDKYHIMESFWKMHEVNILNYMHSAMEGSLKNIMAGAPPAGNPLMQAESAIESRFKQFLSLNEIEGMGIAGVPTFAAMRGVNHRLKLKRGPPRPSFIDTGLYESSFKAWFD